MTNSEKAIACFDNKYNCSQAVFSTFSEQLGLSREIALMIGTGFGAGLGFSGNLCGAVSGAAMVLGLKHGMANSENQGAKDNTYSLTRKFIKRFETKHSSIICRDILGVDLGEPGGKEKAIEKNLFNTVCRDCVRTAVEILEEIL